MRRQAIIRQSSAVGYRHRSSQWRGPTAPQKLALGRAHAHTVVTAHVAEHTITVDFLDGGRRTFRRTTDQPVRSWKAQKPRTRSVS